MVGHKKVLGAGTMALEWFAALGAPESSSQRPWQLSTSGDLTPSFGLFRPLHTCDIHSRQSRINKNQSLNKILLKLSMFYDPTSPFVGVYAK